jgi:predicted dehydrogenase
VPIQVGFFGAGSAARRHAKILQALDAEIVAVCDIAASRAEQFAADFGGNVYSSPGRMFSAENLDALWVCTPPNVRGPVEIAALKAGISLFIEPPVALNLRTAQSVLSALNRSGILCSVGSFWRYGEAFERLKKEIAPKNAPKPLVLAGEWLEGPPATAWRCDAKNSGGLWCDGAYQMLDLARIFGGEVGKVSAFGVGETKSAILEFSNGANGSFVAARALENGFHRAFSLSTPSAIYNLSEGILETRRGVETSTLRGNDDALLAQNAAFLRAVENGKRTEIRATYSDAMKTLRLALALGRAELGSKSVKL